MKCWVITSTIDPTKLTGVVSGRFIGNVELSGSVMFVAYSRLLRQWFMVYGGGEEKIEEPQMIFVEDDWAVTNRLLTPVTSKSSPTKKIFAEQLNLF